MALIVGISGGCRTSELLNLETTDVQDIGESLLITLKDTKTKVNQVFTIVANENSPVNYVELCKRYMKLRKAETTHSRFFVSYRQGKCTVQPVGKNVLRKLPERIAQFLQLRNPQEYTGHCFRSSATTLLSDTGGDLTVIKRHGGWRCGNIADGYIENSVKNKI